MLRNYLTTALRFFRRKLSFSLLNLAGLAVGMTCFILIMLYMQMELSFDRYHKNADRIYRVVAHQPGNVFLGTDHFAVTQAPLAKTLKETFPEVVEAVTLDNAGEVLITIDGESYYEHGLLWANAELFDIFDFGLLRGDPESALSEPFSVVITRELARKYFGDQDPIGQIIRYQNSHDFKVTGILQDVPLNSHFRFDMVSSFDTQIAMSRSKEQFSQWGNSSWYTYILVTQPFDAGVFDEKLKEIVKTYHTENWRDKENPNRYYLQPLTRIHLYSSINFDLARNSDIRYIYLLSALAIVILVIACINYMNLTTARAAQRAREVGMRKVVGANRLQLLFQFVGESLLLTIAAGFVALGLVAALLPIFSNLVEIELSMRPLLQLQFVVVLLGVILFVGLFSGSYPSLLLASFRPVRVLKGTVQKGSAKRFGLRSSLVVLQFTASIALIICTFEIMQQLDYIRSKDLGYEREHILVMRMRDREARKQFRLIKKDLLQNPNFLKVTASDHLPTNVSSSTGLGWTRESGGDGLKSYQTRADYDYLDVFGIELVEGRDFSPEFSTDSSAAYLINETLRDKLGWETGVGKAFGRSKVDGTVIGVFKDFHMHSLRQEIKPLLIGMNAGWSGYASARVRGDDIPGAIDHMRSVWERYSPKYPFEYFFLDDRFNDMYKMDEKLGEVFGYSTFLAIFVACLGLFGLASFLAERKTKEIGVRKILGASLASLLTLLSKDFAKLVLLANVLAWPIAWYIVHLWLQDFAYHITIDLRIFALAGGLALLITLITVSTQAVRAARANPVEALRYE